MVGRGDAWIGLTDSDDLAVGLRQGLPLVSIPLNQELCPIVNSVGWHKDEIMEHLSTPLCLSSKHLQPCKPWSNNQPWSARVPPSEDAPWLKPTWEPLLKDASTGLDQMKHFFMP